MFAFSQQRFVTLGKAVTAVTAVTYNIINASVLFSGVPVIHDSMKVNETKAAKWNSAIIHYF